MRLLFKMEKAHCINTGRRIAAALVDGSVYHQHNISPASSFKIHFAPRCNNPHIDIKI